MITSNSFRVKLFRNALMFVVVFLLALIPTTRLSAYFLNIATMALTFTIISTAFNLVFGYTGLLSLAQVGLWGIGGYTSALIVTRLGWSPWIAFGCAGIVPALVAFVIGFPSLRLSRSAFIVVSLVFTLLMELLSRDWVALTRGPMGLPSLPSPRLEIFNQSIIFKSPYEYYYLMLILALIVIAVIHRLLSSRIGRGLVAIRENELLAKSQGLNTLRYKLVAFMLSAGFTGMAGGIYVFYLTIVDPTIFSFYYIQALLIIVMVGGRGSFWGVILASVFFSVIPELLRMTSNLRLILFGTLLIFVTLYMPEGIGGYFRDRKLKAIKASATQKSYSGH